MKFIHTLLITTFLFIPFSVSAQTPPLQPFVPFGGPIVSIIPCTCSGGLHITITDFLTKAPSAFIFQYGVSRLNMWYNVRTLGVMTLGGYLPGVGICQTGSDCETNIPALGTVTPLPLPGIGTSLVPSVTR